MTQGTARHEFYHCLAAAVAMVQRGVSKEAYEATQVSLSVEDTGAGEFAILPPDRAISDDDHEAIMALSALGPVARHDDPVSLLRSKDAARIVEARNLSDTDLALAAKWSGPETTPCVVLLACKRLEERLGLGGIEKLAKLARSVANQAVDLNLSDLVPHAAAVGALRAGRKRFDKLVDAGLQFDGWGTRA